VRIARAEQPAEPLAGERFVVHHQYLHAGACAGTLSTALYTAPSGAAESSAASP
jgi:hypothetical protein